MTKYSVIQSFFESFGLEAFSEQSVPTSGAEKPDFPYLTYAFSAGSDQDIIQITASLWYRGESLVGINRKTEEISEAVGTAKLLPCDGGAMIVRKGTPFAQPLGDPEDDMIKRKLLLFDISFMTTK